MLICYCCFGQGSGLYVLGTYWTSGVLRVFDFPKNPEPSEEGKILV